MGIAFKMITGDHGAIAMETARRLAMGDSIFPAEHLREMDRNTNLKNAAEVEAFCLVVAVVL